MPPYSAITELSSSSDSSDSEGPNTTRIRAELANLHRFISSNATVSGSGQPSSSHRAGRSTFRVASSDSEAPLEDVPESILARLEGTSRVMTNGDNEGAAGRPRLLDTLNDQVFIPSPSSPPRKRKRGSPPLLDARQLSPSLIDSRQRDEQLIALLDLPLTTSSDPIKQEPAGEPSSSSQPLSSNTTEPISEYSCPICFSPPTRACLTPCGHVMCGPCLFSAIRAAKERHVRLYGNGPGPDGEGKVSRCPVCRAVIKGWNGKGEGVIGLKLELAKSAA